MSEIFQINMQNIQFSQKFHESLPHQDKDLGVSMSFLKILIFNSFFEKIQVLPLYEVLSDLRN